MAVSFGLGFIITKENLGYVFLSELILFAIEFLITILVRKNDK
jgi:hypothetical protein